MSRSTQGCWTCRVRHKKCDETHPCCRVCTSRNIKCHGYGAKPGWIGGPLEEQHRRDIKTAVKQNFKRLRRGISSSSRDGVVEQLRECNNDSERHTPGEHSFHYTSPRSRHSAANFGHSETVCYQALDYAIDPESSAPVHSPVALDQQDHVSADRNVFDYRNAELLMHYFDYVFPLQFRFYTQGLEQGGRGWLLWLLMKAGPLYHAALSLAALHQYTLRYHDQTAKYAELNDYHSKALKDLQLFLQENQGANGLRETSKQIEVLACGVSLISFEVRNTFCNK